MLKEFPAPKVRICTVYVHLENRKTIFEHIIIHNEKFDISDMIEKFAGINPRLQNIMQERDSTLNAQKVANNSNENITTKMEEAKTVTNTDPPRILKGLRGLDPAILKMLAAKEKTKNVQEITQDTEKRKRLELMEELISVSNYASIMMAKNYGKLNHVFTIYQKQMFMTLYFRSLHIS